MTTTTTIEEMIEATMSQIADAAGKRDLATVAGLTQKAGKLEEMKKRVQGIEAELSSMKEFTTPQVAPVNPTTSEVQLDVKLRELPVEVTQGMINQNLLTLTEHVKRGRIRTGEDLAIETYPSGERFRTDLMTNGNKVRERGAIGRFYRKAGVHAGDFVVLTEISPGRWTLKKAPHGQYKSRRCWLEDL
ncbi:MAG: hypothetical protein ACRCXD_05625 [Luteolibacter sp.]